MQYPPRRPNGHFRGGPSAVLGAEGAGYPPSPRSGSGKGGKLPRARRSPKPDCTDSPRPAGTDQHRPRSEVAILDRRDASNHLDRLNLFGQKRTYIYAGIGGGITVGEGGRERQRSIVSQRHAVEKQCRAERVRLKACRPEVTNGKRPGHSKRIVLQRVPRQQLQYICQ